MLEDVIAKNDDLGQKISIFALNFTKIYRQFSGRFRVYGSLVIPNK